MAGSVEHSAGDPATTDEGHDLGVLLAREREVPDRRLLEALLGARCWGSEESRAAAARLLDRHAPWGTHLGPGEAFLCGAPSQHQAALFLEWLHGGEGRTLEAIGRSRGMNAPAVGDAVGRAGRRIRAALEHAPPPWPWLVAELRRRLGAVTTEDLLGDAFERLGTARGSTAAMLATWLAGPYRPVRGHPGWLATDPGLLLSRSTRCVRAEGGVRRLTDVAAELNDLQFAASMLVPWLQASGAVVVHDLVVATGGPLADAAERVLDAHGTARSVVQIAADLAAGGRTVDEPALAAAVRGRRFRPSGEGSVRLAAWGDDAKERRRAKETARRPRLDRARKAEAEAEAAKVAGPLGSHAPRRASALPGLAPEEQLWLWVRVDDAVLRGDGAGVPVELVDGLGLDVHGQRTFSCRWGPVTLAYEGAQPTRGSLRAVARAVGACIGDALLLGFSPAGDLAVEVRGASCPDPARRAGTEVLVHRDAGATRFAAPDRVDDIVQREGAAAAGAPGQDQTLFPETISEGTQ